MTETERFASFVRGDEIEILRILKIHGVPFEKIQERLHFMQEHSCQYAMAMMNDGKSTTQERKKYNLLLSRNDVLIKANEKLKSENNYLKQQNKKLNKMVGFYDHTIGKELQK